MKIASISTLTTISLLLAIPGPGMAKEIAPLNDCVTLSAQHQATRFGIQYLVIRDGDTNYRLEFGGDCPALHSGSVLVTTDKEPNRLCTTGSRVSSKAGSCTVRKVTVIDASEFERYARRARR